MNLVPESDKGTHNELDDARFNTTGEDTSDFFAKKRVVQEAAYVLKQEIVGAVVLEVAEHIAGHCRPNVVCLLWRTSPGHTSLCKK